MVDETLTNEELRKKYPTGTKIRWVMDMTLANKDAKKDIGKIGKIVGYDKRDNPFIFLPESKHIASNSTPLIPVSWWGRWDDLEILYQKNQQLEFAFMQTSN